MDRAKIEILSQGDKIKIETQMIKCLEVKSEKIAISDEIEIRTILFYSI